MSILSSFKPKHKSTCDKNRGTQWKDWTQPSRWQCKCPVNQALHTASRCMQERYVWKQRVRYRTGENYPM